MKPTFLAVLNNTTSFPGREVTFGTLGAFKLSGFLVDGSIKTVVIEEIRIRIDALSRIFILGIISRAFGTSEFKLIVNYLNVTLIAVIN